MRLIDADALREKLSDKAYNTWTHEYGDAIPRGWVLSAIDNAPTVEDRPQGELAEKLKDRIEEGVCKYCQMNKHCELCEISRVFQIITLMAEEQS